MKNITDFIKLCENEHVFEYTLTGDYFERYCIAENDGDIANVLEDTLHRLIDAGATAQNIYTLMGAFIPNLADELDAEDMVELEETNEYISLDLGYVIDGLLLSFTQI